MNVNNFCVKVYLCVAKTKYFIKKKMFFFHFFWDLSIDAVFVKKIFL